MRGIEAVTRGAPTTTSKMTKKTRTTIVAANTTRKQQLCKRRRSYDNGIDNNVTNNNANKNDDRNKYDPNNNKDPNKNTSTHQPDKEKRCYWVGPLPAGVVPDQKPGQQHASALNLFNQMSGGPLCWKYVDAGEDK